MSVNTPLNKITPSRLGALSPVARAIAEDAIRYGLWELVKDEPGAGKVAQ